tara:strand:- start:796 stop:1782 length:987 start_codon:yes stop_codon:yes gene_type:complete
MVTSNLLLAVTIKEKLLENWLNYIKLFTPVQSNFLLDLYKRYHCLDSANIVLFFAKKTHQAILRKKDYDLNYDLSLENFWNNHNEVNIENSTIINIARNTNLPKETARRKITELTKQRVFSKVKKNIVWLPNDEYKKTYDVIINEEIKQLAKLTKYVTDKNNLNFSSEEITNEYKKKFSFYWFHYLDLQLKWMRLWKSQFNDLEVVMIFMQIASLLSSKIDREVSHSSLYSAPDFIVAGPKENNQNISISATSLSDITGIPRATCIRKLNQMVIRKLVTQDEDTKRYHIIPEALAKSLVSKNLTSKVTELFSEFYFIVIKALSIKTTH